jgi:hypothetical protein
MDPILLIIGVVAFLLVAGVILSLIKGVIRIVFSILTIIMLVMGVSLALDAKEFRERFALEEKKMILIEENDVLAGFTMMSAEEEPTFLTQEQVDAYSASLKEDDLNTILGKSYKLMIMDLDVFEEINIDMFDIQGQLFSKELLISVFRSDDPGKLIEEELDATYNADDAELKGAFFGLLFNEVMTSPIYFLEKYKEKDILIYPETTIFKVIRFIPIDLFKEALDTALSKIKDKIPIQRGA